MNEHSGTGLGSRLDEAHYEPIDNSRVKVYRLNKEGLWDDRGTGLITLQHLEVWRLAERLLCYLC